MRAGLAALSVLVLAAVLLPGVRAQEGPVLVAQIDGEITRATVEYVKAAIQVAEADGARALVFRLDTPGGGLQETQEIQRAFLATRVPVVGWVAPSGGNAWSAGTILLLTTDFAAMAPFTVIGSVQPVTVTGEPVTDSKIINAIEASLEEQLRLHDRDTNVTVGGQTMPIAQAFVERNLNVNADEAFSLGLIEAVASSVEGLLAAADGFSLPQSLTDAHAHKPAAIDVAGAPVREFNVPIGVAFFALVANPIVSGLLLLLGIYAIIFGISAPGHGAEIAGVIMVALGVLGLGLAANLVGVFLLVLGIAFLVVEAKTPGFGVWGVSGVLCIVLGTLFLAPIAPPQFLLSRDAQLVILAALLTPTAAFGAFLLFGMYKVMQVRRRKPIIGEFVGEEAETWDPIPAGGRGYILYQGEMWLATAAEELQRGEKVVITAKEGPLLTVQRKAPPPPQAT